MGEDPTRSESDALITEMRERIASLERQLEQERQANSEHLRLLAAALERIPQLEALQETRESSVGPGPTDAPTDSPGGPQTGTERRSVEDGPSSSTYSESARGPFAPVGKIPLWQYAAGVLFSVLAFPLAVVVQASLFKVSGDISIVPLVLLVFPGLFGYWVGRKLSSTRFWYHVSAVGVLIALGSVMATILAIALLRELVPQIFLEPSDIGFAFSSGLLYIFAAVFGNALQLRDRGMQPEDTASRLPAQPPAATQRWSPRQQAIVGLIGTILSALIGLVGTIISMSQ